MPTDSHVWNTYQQIGKSFGSGMLSPYRLVFLPKDEQKYNNTIYNEEAFHAMQHVLQVMKVRE